MTKKLIDLKKAKKQLVDKDSLWGLPLVFFILFFVFLFLINYSASAGPSATAVAQKTSFFALYKVLLSSGVPLVLTGLILSSSSVFPIDFYLKSNSSYLFTNHWLTILFKIIIILIGLILWLLSSLFEPESNIPYSFWDYVLVAIGILFILGIAIQIIYSIKSLIQNKEDYILIDEESLEWFDNKNESVKKIKFSEIKSFTKILEETEKSPEITGIQFNSGMENEFKIEFESMSLIPQSKFIYNIISKKISNKTPEE
jgi:hypothetical protein